MYNTFNLRKLHVKNGINIMVTKYYKMLSVQFFHLINKYVPVFFKLLNLKIL